MRYTIEARELTSESTHLHAEQTRQITIEAGGPDEAIHSFVRDNSSELVSFTRPARGRESIATVKKDESFYLVRVYEG